MVLAIARPDLTVTLVEPLLRRTTFLAEVVAELGLATVRSSAAGPDALHGKRRFDVVTSRAVAPLGRLLEWSMPLVAPEGAMVAMKGGSVAEEISAAGPIVAPAGDVEPGGSGARRGGVHSDRRSGYLGGSDAGILAACEVGPRVARTPNIDIQEAEVPS